MIRGLLLGASLILGAAGVRPAAAQLGDGRNGEFEVVLADGGRRAE